MNVTSKAGRYELQQELGRGSMGIVYRALDPVIGRTVAVKTVELTAEVAGLTHDELLARFQTEARAAGLLAHPNIVVVYDAGEDDGRFYITMELVEGHSLQEQINLKQTFPLPRIMRWMQQACSALEFAHQHSVIHRDIKPANLMLTADDTLKITDFGTAKILQLNTTQTAHVIGTPSYMSPEQIKGKPVDGRTDVFSLGVVFYELLTGTKPFPGDSVTAVIYKVVNEEPIAPRELDGSIHPGLSAIAHRALAKSPWARFQSCREFAEALEHYQDFATTPQASKGPAGKNQAAKKDSGELALVRPPVFIATPAPYLPPAAPARSQGGSLPIVLVLLAIIGGAGYRVWPAMKEVWQRSHATIPVEAVPADTTATPAAQDTLPTLAPLPPSLPAVAVPAVATPASSVPPHIANALKNAAVVSKPSGPPQPSQVAAEWKDLIEAKLAESGIDGKVRVVAAGNTVTLTGKLDTASHSKLLGKLQFVPAGVQIIDDIEYSDEPSQPTSPDASPSK